MTVIHSRSVVVSSIDPLLFPSFRAICETEVEVRPITSSELGLAIHTRSRRSHSVSPFKLGLGFLLVRSLSAMTVIHSRSVGVSSIDPLLFPSFRAPYLAYNTPGKFFLRRKP